MKITTLNNQEAEADNIIVPQLTALGVGHSVQRLFANAFTTDQAGRLIFDYYFGEELKEKEIFGFHTLKLSSSKGLWFAGEQGNPQDIFLFFSAMEAIAFTHLNELKFDFSRNCLFVALGVRPSKYQLDILKSHYKRARFHAVFGNDILGKIYDCKASLWLTNKDCSFFLTNESVQVTEISLKENFKSAEINRDKFTYFSFCRKFGKRPNLKAHKPSKKEHVSFLGYLAYKNQF
jgi:hypothetical protein